MAEDDQRNSGPNAWQAVALFLAGVVVSGIIMVVRGDFLGKEAAMEVRTHLVSEITAVESRLNGRIDREVSTISRDIADIKASLRRLEDRLANNEH